MHSDDEEILRPDRCETCRYLAIVPTNKGTLYECRIAPIRQNSPDEPPFWPTTYLWLSNKIPGWCGQWQPHQPRNRSADPPPH